MKPQSAQPGPLPGDGGCPCGLNHISDGQQYVKTASFEYPRRWPKVLAAVLAFAVIVALVVLGVWLLP